MEIYRNVEKCYGSPYILKLRNECSYNRPYSFTLSIIPFLAYFRNVSVIIAMLVYTGLSLYERLKLNVITEV